MNWVLVFLIAILLLAGNYFFMPFKTGSGAAKEMPYKLVKDWPKLPEGFLLGNPTGLGLDTSGNLVVFHRANRKWPADNVMPPDPISSKTILVINPHNGALLNSWGENLFVMPHGLTVDKQNNIWVTDVALHQVFKFSNEGNMLMKWGEARVPGTDSAHFNLPTDIAVTPDGSFYVSDGYGNSRVVKFSPEGHYVFEWGKKGSGPGEFNIPHAIDLDREGNVYVADRENGRIQVFDSAGRFLKQYTHRSFGSIPSVFVQRENQAVVAVDDYSFLKIKHRGSDVLVFDTAGTVQNRFGRSGHYEGHTTWYHDLVVDKQGNIYVGDILGNTLQKFGF